jgi:hypothetical protein
MGNRLSYSSINLYQECPYSYKLRYKDSLYSKTIGSSLVFGKAIDGAIEFYLKDRMDYLGARDKFYELWSKFELNGETHNTIDSELIVYGNRDIDLDLITEDDLKVVEQYALDLGLKEDDTKLKELVSSIQKQKDIIGYKFLPKERKIMFNVVCYHTLKTKGELMLNTFKRVILPQIEGVISLQEPISILNGSGDEIVGYIDAVLKWRGIEEPIVFDFKTSARPYEDDAVLTSSQLSVYVNAVTEKYKTRKAGYIVLSKAINKNKNKICSECGYDGTGANHRTCPEKDTDGNRCNGEWKIGIDPQCVAQVIINDLPESIENLVMENMDVINSCINNNIYSRNLNNCMTRYNTLCSYYDVCHGGCYDGVFKKLPIQEKTN